MKRAAFAALLAAMACGAPAATPVDPGQVVLPQQPPQPVPRIAPPTPVVPAVEPPPFRCDDGIRFQVSGRTYCAYAEPKSWDVAEMRCVTNGGHLMSLDTTEMSQAIRDALWSPVGGERAAWIGLSLSGKGAQGKWKWISGEDLTVASWNSGEPNNFGGNEGCAEWLVSDGRWNDTRCNLPQGYLCELKPTATCRRGRAFAANGSSYCLHPGALQWGEVKRACATDGGSLAVLRTSEENASVRSAMAARFAPTKLWIGLTDAADEGNWGWVSGAPFEHQAWHSGEPNDFNRENCGQLYSDSWTWNDLDCGVLLPSVCESPAARR